jgi:hypothetical protein
MEVEGDASQDSLNDKQVRELKQVALKLFDAIVAKDVPAILRQIDPEGINWGGDGSRTYAEVEQDLRSRNGPLFCVLFGCPGSPEIPARTYLVKAKRSKLKIYVHYHPEFSDSQVKYASVTYDWPGKPQEFVRAYSLPEFRWYQESGWKCARVFEY